MSSTPYPPSTSTARRISPRRVAAIGLWCIGANLTGDAITQIGIAAGATAIAYAICFQAILTLAESDIWHGRRALWVSYAALLADIATNYRGSWKIAASLDRLDSWRAFQESLNTGFNMPDIIKLALTLAIAAFIAAAPEALWKE